MMLFFKLIKSSRCDDIDVKEDRSIFFSVIHFETCKRGH